MVVRSKLALVGSVLGFLAIAVVSAFLASNLRGDPDPDHWRLVIIVMVAAPYCASLAAAFTVSAAARTSTLLGATIASLAFGVLLFTLGPLLFPATLVLAAATINAYAWDRMPAVATAFRVFAGIFGGALLIGAFFALFATQDERCWETIRYPDGRTETYRIDPPADGRLHLSSGAVQAVPPGEGGTVGAGCTSDFVTFREAVQSLALTLAGFVILIAAGRMQLGPSSWRQVSKSIGH